LNILRGREGPTDQKSEIRFFFISKKNKLESKFFLTPCIIRNITAANKYVLEFIDGFPIPHKRKNYDRSTFVQKRGKNLKYRK